MCIFNNIFNKKCSNLVCENTGKSCKVCSWLLCNSCYIQWLNAQLELGKTSFTCPQCRNESTYNFRKRKIIPMEKPIDNNSFIVEISDNSNQTNDERDNYSCNCLIFCDFHFRNNCIFCSYLFFMFNT